MDKVIKIYLTDSKGFFISLGLHLKWVMSLPKNYQIITFKKLR